MQDQNAINNNRNLSLKNSKLSPENKMQVCACGPIMVLKTLIEKSVLQCGLWQFFLVMLTNYSISAIKNRFFIRRIMHCNNFFNEFQNTLFIETIKNQLKKTIHPQDGIQSHNFWKHTIKLFQIKTSIIEMYICSL